MSTEGAHGTVPRGTGVAGLVAGLTVVALLLRLFGANAGPWIDEIYSLLRYFRLPLGESLTHYPHDNHHPLYTALAHVAMQVFGESAWAMRLPSILAGTASVPLLFVLGRRVASTRDGLFAAALLAVSWHHVWYSQNARGYVLMAMLAIAGTLLLVRIIEGAGWGAVLLYAVCAGLGAFTHLTMVFIVVGHAVAMALVWGFDTTPVARPRLAALASGAFVGGAAATLLLYLPMLGDVIAHFRSTSSDFVQVSTTGWAALETVRVLVRGFGAGSLVIGGVAIAGAAGLMVVGTVSYWRRQRAALLLFTAPLGVIFAGAALARGTFYPRFLFALIGFALLIGVRGALVTGDWVAARWAAERRLPLGELVLGLAIVLSLVTTLRTAGMPKQDFEGAAAYIQASRERGDVVAVAGATVAPLGEWLGLDVVEVTRADEVAAQRRRGTVWLVTTLPRYLGAGAPELVAMVPGSCDDVRRFAGTVGDGDVTVCRLGQRP